MTKLNKQLANLRFAVLAVDATVITYHDGTLFIRLIPVTIPNYYNNTPGLPGGLIYEKEVAEQTSLRLIHDKANILTEPKNFHLEQIYTFTALNRDPRNRVVAVAYMALIPWAKLSSSEKTNSKHSWWCAVKNIPKLAYDHNEIVNTTLERLRSKIEYTNIIAHLLPNEFTLTELKIAYETVLNTKLDKRNFRKKVLATKLLKKLKKKRTGLQARPADLYSFTSKKLTEVSIV